MQRAWAILPRTAPLDAEHAPACPISLYFPVRFVDGKVQRIARLKQIAVAGGLGVNTLLPNRRFGSWLLLAGVVTGAPAPKTRRRDDSDAPLCTGRGACIRACLEGALGPNGIDAFRCRNVRTWILPPVVPAALYGVHLYPRRGCRSSPIR